jgi:hypothetical protein
MATPAIKVFTVDDVVSVDTIQRGTGQETEIMCKILFKGCTNKVDFYANLNGRNPFTIDMWNRLHAEQWGEVVFPPSDYRTLPTEQEELEVEVRANRDALLQASDWTDTTAGQSRLTADQITAYATYRQSLRDLTAQQEFPWDPTWPTAPQ